VWAEPLFKQTAFVTKSIKLTANQKSVWAESLCKYTRKPNIWVHNQNVSHTKLFKKDTEMILIIFGVHFSYHYHW